MKSSMPSGKYYSMTTSLKRGSMASSSPVVTGWFAASILAYLLILVITLKSMGYRPFPYLILMAVTRVLLASIRNLGACPCPRCLIPISRAHKFGMACDITQRVTMARVDDKSRQNKVYAARRLIYEKQYRINGTAIEKLLKDESLVPNTVR
jgi:hypothetical protein